MPLATALDGSEPLALLLRRLQDSQRRFDAAAPALPAELRRQTRPGPLDDSAWTLLADHPAAAAKLRQLVPAIQTELGARGLVTPTIRIKVQPPT